jgi:hypothetical protein
MMKQIVRRIRKLEAKLLPQPVSYADKVLLTRLEAARKRVGMRNENPERDAWYKKAVAELGPRPSIIDLLKLGRQCSLLFSSRDENNTNIVITR